MSEAARGSRQWRFYVSDMIEFGEKIVAYTSELDQAAFVRDSRTYDATLRNLELIGEAATHVPQRVRDAHEEIAWREIVALRNRLIHAYLGIDDTLLHIALNGTAAHVERTVRGFRRVRRHLERDEAEAMHERRYLNCRRESNGSVRVEARLAPEVGEMLIKALEAAGAELDKRDGEADNAGASALESVSAETPPKRTARRGWRR